MIELPELSILLILEYLSYEDLQSLRLTCKKLKAIVDQRIPRSLHLFVGCYLFEGELLHTGELISYANTFRAPDLTILNSTKFKSLFTGLRKLTISTPGTVDLDDLNYFQSLVLLQLEHVNISSESRKLSLRNLKIAFLENENYETANFVLDCPQLQVLGIGRRTTPALTQETANSVRHLHICEARDIQSYLFVLYAKLSDLSIICFDKFHAGETLMNFVRALMERRVCLPLLKQIQVKEPGHFPERGVALRNLAELKNRTETKHIEVLINGKVVSGDELTEIQDLLHKIFPLDPDDPMNFYDQNLYIANFKRDLFRHFNENLVFQCLLPDLEELILESDEDVAICKQLISKLGNLERLIIKIALDEQFFECILKSCRRIWFLEVLACAHLRQQQLDQIPDYLQNIRRLRLGSEFGQMNFDLNFVTKFKNLFHVLFHYNIPKETMSFFFENYNHRARFEIELYGMQTITIYGSPNENDRFKVICSNEDITSDSYGSYKTTEFDSLEEAIEHYYRNDLFNSPWDDTKRTAFRFPCSLI